MNADTRHELEEASASRSLREDRSLDLNLSVICGTLASEAERKEFESGTRLIRLLVTVRQERRVDVIPVTVWDPDSDLWDSVISRDQRVWVVGSVQRRFWDSFDGRRSRLEVVADQVILKEES